ncbi:uncharacterized protein LOC101453238 [Ceratitis capitata]|uniref:uncharacterized protein LOC101453238 n=1 Tax=Ceratitis capitata TaxID=7213 RepID=UPI00032974E5|nr:uncharacterized protein LOC101453238 [Ceratitis capitata]
MLLLHNITALLGLIEFSATNEDFLKIIKDIVAVTATAQKTKTLIYASNGFAECNRAEQDKVDVALQLNSLLNPKLMALISIDGYAPTKPYKRLFSLNVLSVVQLNGEWESDQQLVRKLLMNLDRNRQSGIILLFCDAVSQTYATWIMQHCAEVGAINVIALQPNMTVKEQSYWTLQLFPEKQIVQQKLPTFYRGIFPDHLSNMHGCPLRFIASGWHPQIYNYISPAGKVRLSGYLGNTFNAYAHHRNATVLTPGSYPNGLLNYPQVRNILLNNGADMGPLWPFHLREDSLGYTSTLHRFDLCLMVPVENRMPRSTFYYKVFGEWFIILLLISLILICVLLTPAINRKGHVFLDHSFNIDISVLQGFLGMPFWFRTCSSRLHKFISIIIVFAGINVNTTYVAHLQSFIVNSPIDKPIKSIGDLVNRGIMVAMDTNVYPKQMGEEYFLENYDKFTLLKNATELLVLRDDLDTRFAFPVSNMWDVYNEQQKFFGQPLFRISNICFQKGGSLLVPLPANSIYRESLNDFIGRIRSAGLTDFWLRSSFFELVKMKRITIEDRNPLEVFKPMKVEDLQYILLIMSCLISLSFGCFALEILWMKIKKQFFSNKKVDRKLSKNPQRQAIKI